MKNRLVEFAARRWFVGSQAAKANRRGGDEEGGTRGEGHGRGGEEGGQGLGKGAEGGQGGGLESLPQQRQTCHVRVGSAAAIPWAAVEAAEQALSSQLRAALAEVCACVCA